jgi:CheY-like chemotaxis protein
METPQSPLRHELRTAIHQIVGYADLLIDDTSAEGLDRFTGDLQKIRVAGQSLLERLEPLFTPEGGAIAARPQPDTSRHDPEPRSCLWPSMVGTPLLVVDDNAGNRELLARLLRPLGFEVAGAPDGETALTMLGAFPYDAVLLDMQLPRIDGFSVLQEIKADPVLRAIPVLMISALDELETVARCIEAGAVDFLTKPFHTVLLRARLEATLLQKRESDRAARRYAELAERFAPLERARKGQSAWIEQWVRDLRTGLAGLRTSLEMPAHLGPLHGDQAAFLETARQSSTVLDGMLDEFITMIRFEAGTLLLEREIVDTEALLQTVMDALAVAAYDRGVTLTFARPQTIPLLYVDRIRLQCALRSIVDYALRATPAAGQVTIATTPSASGRALVFTVEFSGRAPQGRDSSPALMVSRRVIEAHGGRLALEEDREGGGIAVFTIPLPAR